MTQTKALLYIYWLLMINTLFVEQISHQINFFAENNKRSFFSLWRRLFNHLPSNEKAQVSKICRYGMNLMRLQTPPYDDTQGIYKRTWKRVKTLERNSKMCEWIFHQLAAKNLKVNAVQQSIASAIRYCKGQKKYSIHYLTGQNRGLSGLKIFDWSSWPATSCPLFWELTYALRLTFLNWSQKCDYTFL